jgi:hypothetical protein
VIDLPSFAELHAAILTEGDLLSTCTRVRMRRGRDALLRFDGETTPGIVS